MALKQRHTVMHAPIHLNEGVVFDLIYQTYYHPLCFYASKYVGANAEDVIEELFVKLWFKKQVFNDSGHLRAFLYTAARNASLDFLRANQKHDRYTDHEIAEDMSISEEDHLHFLIRAEVRAEIYRAVSNLPSQCSKVVALSFFDGLSNAEIADQLGLSEQTVKNHKVRGLNMLRDRLSGDAMTLLMFVVWIN